MHIGVVSVVLVEPVLQCQQVSHLADESENFLLLREELMPAESAYRGLSVPTLYLSNGIEHDARNVAVRCFDSGSSRVED